MSSEQDRRSQRIHEMYAAGESDEAVADWLRSDGANIVDGAKAIEHATGRQFADAVWMLRESPSFNRGSTSFTLSVAEGEGHFGTFKSPTGRTFAVGDHFNLPNAPEPPHRPAVGRGTVWRVIAVDTSEDPAITAQLTIEPVRRLPDEN
jgi:hypothetical protein